MRPRPAFFYLASPKFAFAVALVAAVAVFLDASLAADAAAEMKISRVELGFKNHFKVGHWTPVRVEIAGVSTGDKQIEVTVGDNDGVPTTAGAPVLAADDSRGSASAVVYTKVGRVGTAIQISLVDQERRIDEQKVRPDTKAKSNSAAVALPATAELIVSLGAAPFGLRDAFPNRDSESQTVRHIVELTRVADLPTDWFRFDAVDVLIISAGNGDLCRELAVDT